jgi:glycosyltransferase involved in cell wall biosynthesis
MSSAAANRIIEFTPLSHNNKTMKVGYLSQPWEYSHPPNLGSSISRWTWEVSRRFSPPNEAMVVSPSTGKRPARHRYDRVDYLSLPLIGDRLLLKTLQKLERHRGKRNDPFASSFYYPIYALLAACVFRNARCQIVHIHNFSQFAPIIRRINRRAKIVLHMHSDWLKELEFGVIAKRLANVDAVVGNSAYVTDAVERRFPHHASRCFTIFNGVNVNSFRPSPRTSDVNPDRIVYLGRLSPEKGVHVLIDAFAQVAKQLPRAELELIGAAQVVPRDFIVDLSSDPLVRSLGRFYGDEGYEEYLRRSIRERSLVNVFFTGELGHEELANALRAAALLVAPSIVETFGMPVVEAMASAVPVVASRVGGLPELVIDGSTGILVAPDSAEGLAAAIVRLVTDRDTSRKMRLTARQRAETMFSWEAVVQSVMHLYKHLSS